MKNANSERNDRIFQKDLEVASRRWTVVVVEVEEDSRSDLIFVIMGGVVIFLAAAFLSAWMFQHARRAGELYKIAAEADAGNLMIVRELFPSNVRDRLVADAAAAKERRKKENELSKKKGGETKFLMNKRQSETLDSSMSSNENVFGSTPIADLFPNVTIVSRTHSVMLLLEQEKC